jgi:biotin carboxyl carrier protein
MGCTVHLSVRTSILRAAAAALGLLMTLVVVPPAAAQEAFTLTVTLRGNAIGMVTSDPAGVACGEVCAASFPPGTAVTLISTPGAGVTFEGWSGDCAGAETCVVILDADRSTAATFGASYRPGAMVRRSDQAAYRGRWVIDPSAGPRQTVDAKTGRGERASFVVRVVNDGALPDSVRIAGTGDRGGAAVRYLRGGEDVTAAIEDGSLVADLAPGADALLRVVVTVAPTAKVGALRAWTVAATSVGDPNAADAVRAEVEVVWRPVPFARAAGITLVEPGREIVAVTYHESLFGSAAALHPFGHVVRNASPDKFDPPPSTPGPGYIVMDTRGRPTPATSAADLVMETTTPVRSPVTGRVLSVTSYLLYCDTPDVRVMIRPEADHTRSVLVVHVTGVHVESGDHVVAGRTVLGRPRQLPYHDQTDDYVAGGHPHVHIEIERDGSSPLPGCR